MGGLATTKKFSKKIKPINSLPIHGQARSGQAKSGQL
jgi:hypothetical protein